MGEEWADFQRFGKYSDKSESERNLNVQERIILFSVEICSLHMKWDITYQLGKILGVHVIFKWLNNFSFHFCDEDSFVKYKKSGQRCFWRKSRSPAETKPGWNSDLAGIHHTQLRLCSEFPPTKIQRRYFKKKIGGDIVVLNRF